MSFVLQQRWIESASKQTTSCSSLLFHVMPWNCLQTPWTAPNLPGCKSNRRWHTALPCSWWGCCEFASPVSGWQQTENTWKFKVMACKLGHVTCKSVRYYRHVACWDAVVHNNVQLCIRMDLSFRLRLYMVWMLQQLFLSGMQHLCMYMKSSIQVQLSGEVPCLSL